MAASASARGVVLLSGGVVVAASEPAALGGRDVERTRISFRLPAGYTAADVPVPSRTANGMVVDTWRADTGAACYGQLAVALAARRQAGILKRIRATPTGSRSC